MQLTILHKSFDKLQLAYGHASLCSIYGAGCVHRPKVMFVFMNPTGRNVASEKQWKGIRAPWLGTKNVWKLFSQLRMMSPDIYARIQTMKPNQWTTDFSLVLYRDLARRGIYITELAKCTQIDARPVSNTVFKQYLDLMYREIELVNPKKIFTFGNQVSSILLAHPIFVGQYTKSQKEILRIGKKKFNVYPVWYPVGQGMRNMEKARKRIKTAMR